jgi:site-specific recombinase XerD
LKTILFNTRYYKAWDLYSTIKKTTKEGYKSQLKKLDQFLILSGLDEEFDFDKFYYSRSTGNYAHVDEDFFLDFHDYLTENHQSVIYHCMVAVKHFMEFLYRMELINHNPVRYFKNPKRGMRIRDRSLSEKQSFQLLKAAYEIDPFFKQWYLLILVMLSCGLRANEVCHLRYSQIFFDSNMIAVDVAQKTHADTVLMTPALIQAFHDYFNHPSWENWSQGEDKEVFFLNGQSLKYQNLRSVLKSICEHAQLDRNVTCHDLRHSMSSQMLRNRASIVDIQKRLRHKDPSTTMLYLPPETTISNAINEYVGMLNLGI